MTSAYLRSRIRSSHSLSSGFFRSHSVKCVPLLAVRRNARAVRHRVGLTAQALSNDLGDTLTDTDLEHLAAAATASQASAGLTFPHPNHGATLVSPSGSVIATACHRAQGAPSAEELLFRQVRGVNFEGSTVYLNLETGDCHGDTSALEWLVHSGVSRVVIGIRHPLPHMRGAALGFLRSSGMEVQLLEAHPEVMLAGSKAHSTLHECLQANEPLLHRAVHGRPMSVLKYAMTLDGKIATHTGHSAWVSTASSRARVFEMRARSDCVIVGGNTVRRDNPRLTTRRDGGHRPARIVMSRTLDLPEDANLWDTTAAPTIVMTQRGARRDMQARLQERGVEVVEFDFLTPMSVADYCGDRGFMQCFWECGGTLSAPAISSGTINKVMAFIAPKIIGGRHSYTPVGNLGFVEMTQAVRLVDPKYEIIDEDILASGALAPSGTLLSLFERLSSSKEAVSLSSAILPHSEQKAREDDAPEDAPPGLTRRWEGAVQDAAEVYSDPAAARDEEAAVAGRARRRKGTRGVVEFYKAWDEWGALSNFSPHGIDMPPGQGDMVVSSGGEARSATSKCRWETVEHYYQAQKFTHAEGAVSEDVARRAAAIVDEIVRAPSPEEAARIGRFHECVEPELVRVAWGSAKVDVMMAALLVKYTSHAGPQRMLLSTDEGGQGLELVEGSPHDFFWGRGCDGSGQNMLGTLLMRIRSQLLRDAKECELDAVA